MRFYGDPSRTCACHEAAVSRYRKRLSVPIPDRIDLHLWVPRVDFEKLAGSEAAETSAQVCERVPAARARQWQRLRDSPATCNAEMRLQDIQRACQLDPAAANLLRSGLERPGLSARPYLRVARTIADLAESDPTYFARVAEALQCQPAATGPGGYAGAATAQPFARRLPPCVVCHHAPELPAQPIVAVAHGICDLRTLDAAVSAREPRRH